jgi:hypothetical protein
MICKFIKFLHFDNRNYNPFVTIQSYYFYYENRFSNGNQIISNGKLLKLKEIYGMMTAKDKNRRPNCEKILAKKYSWYLNPLDSSLKDFIHESLALNSAEKSFSHHFIQQKFKYYSNNYEESYNQEMKKKNTSFYEKVSSVLSSTLK